MLLLTDGTVMVQEHNTANWYRLTPDMFGSYENGSWSSLASSPNAPEFYASAVLRDGRVFVAGGEYDAGVDANLNTCAIYDPAADRWTALTSSPGFPVGISDAPCCVLPDGRVLLGATQNASASTAIYDPVADRWAHVPARAGTSWEETWTLLPDETVLAASVLHHPAAEKYVAAAGNWVSAGSVPAAADVVGDNTGNWNDEIGPAILLPDGRVFCIGATGHTALYTPPTIARNQGTWDAGPDLPSDSNGNIWLAFDAPAVLLPNGKVLGFVGATTGQQAGNPVHCFESDGTSMTAVADPPNAATAITAVINVLLLPTGQVLVSAINQDMRLYTPDGAADPHWAPWITSCPSQVMPGQTYTLRGCQLTGLSQANSYGDDATMATNYPLVRLRNLATNHVTYCKTHDHSTMGVATGTAVHSTQFDVPATTETGLAELSVVANGIAATMTVTVGAGSKPGTGPGVHPGSGVSFTGIFVGSATVDGGGFIIGPDGILTPIGPVGPIEDVTAFTDAVGAVASLLSNARALPSGEVRRSLETAAHEVAHVAARHANRLLHPRKR